MEMLIKSRPWKTYGELPFLTKVLATESWAQGAAAGARSAGPLEPRSQPDSTSESAFYKTLQVSCMTLKFEEIFLEN